jgi:hypothetical protein
MSESRGLRRAEIGSAIAIALSVLAVVVSFSQARIAERQAHASVWPYVSIGYSMYDGSDAPGFTLTVDNDGLGPAIIDSVVVSVDGVARRSWADVIAALGMPDSMPHTTSSINGRVLPPNLNRETTVQAIHLPVVDDARKVAAQKQRIKIEICYCSVYDECWIAEFLGARVTRVDHCDATGTQFEK